MRKHHQKTLKFHTVFTLILALICLGIILIAPDLTLVASITVLVVYVAGNGIIHLRNNQLSRDSLIEYIIVGLIVALIVLGAVLQ